MIYEGAQSKNFIPSFINLFKVVISLLFTFPKWGYRNRLIKWSNTPALSAKYHSNLILYRVEKSRKAPNESIIHVPSPDFRESTLTLLKNRNYFI